MGSSVRRLPRSVARAKAVAVGSRGDRRDVFSTCFGRLLVRRKESVVRSSVLKRSVQTGGGARSQYEDGICAAPVSSVPRTVEIERETEQSSWVASSCVGGRSVSVRHAPLVVLT